jgi:hypothetical protein
VYGGIEPPYYDLIEQFSLYCVDSRRLQVLTWCQFPCPARVKTLGFPNPLNLRHFNPAISRVDYASQSLCCSFWTELQTTTFYVTHGLVTSVYLHLKYGSSVVKILRAYGANSRFQPSLVTHYSREYFTFVNPLNSACPLLGGYVISLNIPFQLRNSRTKAIVGFTM